MSQVTDIDMLTTKIKALELTIRNYSADNLKLVVEIDRLRGIFRQAADHLDAHGDGVLWRGGPSHIDFRAEAALLDTGSEG